MTTPLPGQSGGNSGQRSCQVETAYAMACWPSVLTQAPLMAVGYSPMTGQTLVTCERDVYSVRGSQRDTVFGDAQIVNNRHSS
jgi:hypothetical protein